MQPKDKNIAGLLGIFLGGLGVHWFYLRKPLWGGLHAMFFWTMIPWLIGMVQGIVWLSMDTAEFDGKYNSDLERTDFGRYDPDFERNLKFKQTNEYHARYGNENTTHQVSLKQNRRLAKRHINEGNSAFAEYEYERARAEYEKAIDLDPTSQKVHWKLACCYSLLEDAERSLYHLEQSIINGFGDFSQIKEEDALAYLRIQPEFNTFESNGFRSTPSTALESPKENLLNSETDLLDQLKKLHALKEKGQLTESAFQKEKRKLLG